MKKDRILWADDEIDLLRPHILFLEEKGYEIVTVNSGQDAIESCESEDFDLIFLDENMPGLTGLQTLSQIKSLNPNIPVIMITKSEDEGIMTHAIGKKIADYLIKPVNPNQILLSIKKNLHKRNIISEVTLEGYRQEYNQISGQISMASSAEDWMDVYRKISYWDIELSAAQSPLLELLHSQKQEANQMFSKYIKRNYENWMEHPDEHPLMSHELFKKKVFPLLDEGEKVFFVLVDNFRLDQWWIIKDLLSETFNINEELYYSILPTATQYARNAIFSGLLPNQIAKMFPELWVDEDEEEGKNLNEEPLIRTQIERFRKKYTFSYNKLLSSNAGDKLLQNFNSLAANQLNVLVINFVDMLSHARTDSKMIRELAGNEAAYRSLTRSWFEHSGTLDLLIQVNNPMKVIGDKATNTNLRYKVGKNLNYDHKKVFEINHPERIGLPSLNVSSKYIFAMNGDFFAYPNNYNYYATYYSGTFQHGGISLEEMVVPFITLSPK
jgi:CheY-like chemotaxis protein